MTHGQDPAPGWDAISAACARLYPDERRPLHYGTLVRWSLGGNDPLDGISVHRATDPVPHWHFVSYGLSDLYGTEPAAPDARSGWGFELTFRLADPAALDPAAEPPRWPLNLLQNLARYVVKSGNAFDAGHHLDARGPIAAGTDTALTALAFELDPQLGVLQTPRGRVSVLLLHGLTAAELSVAQTWTTTGVLDLLQQRHPGGVTVLDRPSITDDPAVQALVAAGTARDGSQQSLLTLQSLTVAGTSVTVPTAAVAQLIRVLPGRLPHGRGLLMDSADASVTFEPGTTRALELDGTDLTIRLTSEGLTEFTDHVRAVPGTYRAVGVTWTVTA